jgi:hypothetical protein
MVINKSIPALYNGVSQQPATVRLPSQCEAMENFYPTVVDALRRRPPTEHIARLSTGDFGSAYLHTINRDVEERYTVVMTDGNIQVFDLDGNPKTVAMPGRQPWAATTAYPTVNKTVRPTTPNGFLYRVATSGTSGSTQPTWPTTLGATVTDGTVTWQCVPDYLNVNDPKTDFVLVSVADYTFVVNRTVVCSMSPVGADEFVPDTSSISPKAKWKNKGWTWTGPMAVRAVIREQYGPNDIGYFRGTKQTLQDLAEVGGSAGDIWKIAGNSESAFSTYYVIRKGGTWQETVAPNLANRILECTMPHALVRLEDGTFEFNVFSWAPRRVGSEETNPNPAFITRRIRDVFFYKNRLGFAVDEGVAMSRVGDFGNFYRLTVLDLLDDETISISASATGVTLINSAVPFNEGMMLFADQKQFRFKHGDVLKPTSAGLDEATSYVMAQKVRPLPLGSDVYFASEDGEWARVWEYYVKERENTTDAGDVTGHVPRYIPSGVSRIAGSSQHDALFLLTDGAPSRIYCYKFYWSSETEKAQSSWGYWEFAPDTQVLSAEVVDHWVYIVEQRPDGAYLTRCALESGAQVDALGFQVFLDRRAVVDPTWLPTPGKTEWTLPYDVEPSARADFRIVRGAAFEGAVGALVSVNAADYEWIDARTVRVPGRFDAGDCYAGLRFTSRYTFSPQFMKNTQNVPIVTGRLILSGYTVYFTGTAYFKTEVAPYGGSPDIEEIIPDRIAQFDGKTLGASQLVLGAPVFAEGSYTSQVYGDARVARVSLVNDSPYASTFTQAEWTGIYHNVARTI